MSPAPVSTSIIICTWSLVALVRVLIAFQPHSGQDNHHGLHAAYGGDFEVQRHWMELTFHLPIGEWYYDDPTYFGLDYPPLTAYVSYVCGYFSDKLVGSYSVAWMESRGLEDPRHKALMRATVLLLDLLVFGSAVWCMTRPQESLRRDYDSLATFVLVMIQPAILLIDHGHFQYNTFALGLCLWAFHFMSKPGHCNCLIGSIFYCLALSFKQMTLYFAPAVFFYLLGRCCAEKGRYFTLRFVSLGITVVATISVMFLPVVLNGPDETTYLERLTQVMRRIFPLHRGLFESKVSNTWCVLSLKPFRIRQQIPEHLQPMAALFVTILLTMPCSVSMFRLGSRGCMAGNQERQRTIFSWGMTSSALAFFLASFQVHEKSILLALAPACLLAAQDYKFVEWFSIVATWSLWPLLQIDRLQTAYFCTMVIYLALLHLRKASLELPQRDEGSLFSHKVLFSWLSNASYAVMITLHLLEATITVPSNLPDLFSVLWSLVGCGCFGVAWLYTCWRLAHGERKEKLN
ncbi:hypothetical protein MPSEU_000135700 [Mayamaea pseudoterrestris]|nr:hypothetical protein MPSEU_000135700 [Mayamaea pseudoterrestris]